MVHSVCSESVCGSAVNCEYYHLNKFSGTDFGATDNNRFAAILVNSFKEVLKSRKNRCKVRQTWICIAPRHEHTYKALRCGTRSPGIPQFYLHASRSFANGMNHTCLFLPSRSWFSFRCRMMVTCLPSLSRSQRH